MKCPNCSAECSDQSATCDFCGQSLAAAQTQEPAAEPVMPPAPPMAAPPQANPYQGPAQSTRPNQAIPNHLTFAIVTAIVSTMANLFGCCCFPITLATGIAAIVFALKVDKLVQGDDIAGALQASKTAKMWCWVTTVLGIVFGLWFIVSLVLQAMGLIDQEAMQDIIRQMGAGR